MTAYDSLSGAGFGIFSQLRHRGELHPEKIFARDDTTTLTYGALYESVNRVANALRAMGVQAGERVGLYMNNRPEFFQAMYGTMRAGAVYVPFSTRYAPPEVEYQLNHVEAKVVFADPEHAGVIRKLGPTCPSVKHVVTVGDDVLDGDVALAGLMAAASPGEPSTPIPEADDLALIMYTSGTTARPKGVMWSHGNLVTHGATIADAFQWNEDDKLLHYFPLFHANGGLTNTLPVIRTGASMVMIQHFSVSQFWEQLTKYEITKVNANVTNFRWLLKAPTSPHERSHRLTTFRLGLKAEPDEVVAFEKRFGVRVVGAYGLTESLSIVVAQHPALPSRPGAAGRVLRGYSVRLVDDAGDDVPVGSPGEVWIRGQQRHALSLGYYRDPEKTAQVYGADGWLHTGDVGRFDEDGYFWFIERKKDMIKRSGFNVAPAEVERVIASLAGVEDVAVVGIPDPDREEAIVAFVVLAANSPLTAEEIRAACVGELSDYKVPQWVRVVGELPRNYLGKVERQALRDLF